MAVLRQRHHNHHRLSTVISFTFILLFSTLSQLGIGLQEREKENGLRALDRVLLAQKRVTGPGSSPPTCRSKCDKCTPCVAVHVPIQPGLSMPLEYYPEAWRCKCGNKLYMP